MVFNLESWLHGLLPGVLAAWSWLRDFMASRIIPSTQIPTCSKKTRPRAYFCRLFLEGGGGREGANHNHFDDNFYLSEM